MASIYDLDGPPVLKELKPAKRTKHQEPLTQSELVAGHRRLSEMVEKAFNTLERATECADWNTAIKAAQIILDRAGFGPKSTVDVNKTLTVDLSTLSREELAERAMRIAAHIKTKQQNQLPVIDATASVN